MCDPYTHNANYFIDLPDVVPEMVNFTQTLAKCPLSLQITDQRDHEVDFILKQGFLNGEVERLSVYYRPSTNESAC